MDTNISPHGINITLEVPFCPAYSTVDKIRVVISMQQKFHSPTIPAPSPSSQHMGLAADFIGCQARTRHQHRHKKRTDINTTQGKTASCDRLNGKSTNITGENPSFQRTN